MMRFWAAVCVFLALGAASSVEGLKCNEGFNMSVSGVPFYHWKERTCTANSDCFGQEIMVRMPLGTVNFDLVMRYGSCISSVYKDYLDCDKLFGKDSTQDPAVLLDLIPEIVDRFEDTISDFSTNALMELKTLFSSGKGTSEFIDGIFTMMATFGFDMQKAIPLKPTLAKLLESLFSNNQTASTTAVNEFFNALGNLDTANQGYTDGIKKLIGTIDSSFNIDADQNVVLKTIIERVPGLLRSMLNSDWQPNLWYDVVFKLMGDIDSSNWTKTAEDMVKTIRSSYTIPQEVLDIINPTLNAIPDLVKNSQVNDIYIGTWSLELLKEYSKVDAATTAFSDALIKFIESLTNVTLQEEYKTTIKYMPGLFYKFFPTNEADIQKVYNKMAEGFNSFNFADFTDTAATTKLSDFILDFIPKVVSGVSMTDFHKAIVINAASTIYGLLSDYTAYLDTFAEVMTEGFVNFPNFNAGTIVTNLITRMNGTVPDEIKPLLANIQGVFDAAAAQTFNEETLMSAFDTIINAYKTAYPNSPFPDLVKQYITILTKQIKDPTKDYTLDYVYWNIDFQFAIIDATNMTYDDFDKLLMTVFPDYEIQLKMLRLLKAEDVKELVKKIAEWMAVMDKTPENFVAAIKPTVQKITASINSLLGELKTTYAPNSCKHGTCSEDLCNGHAYIKGRPAVTKAPKATPSTPTTTSSGEMTSYNILLNIAAMWMACKVFFG